MAAHFAAYRTVEPAAEPLLLTDVKDWLRVDTDDTTQDSLISSLIADARDRCERVTQLALITQTWRQSLDRFPFWGWDTPLSSFWGQPGTYYDPSIDPRMIRLNRYPVASITYLKYVDTNGVLQTLASDQYELDLEGQPARLRPAYGLYWPVTRNQINSVQITYVAGYGAAASNVPGQVRQRLLAHISYCYEHRLEQDEEYLNKLFDSLRWTW